jgi:uncharacterized protein YciI
MSGEIPEGLAIEQIWVAESVYAPDAAQKRPPVRAEHLARIGRLRAEGLIVEAGAFADMSGSLLLLRVPTEAAALELLQADVYWRAGIWTSFRIRSLGHVVRVDEVPGL